MPTNFDVLIVGSGPAGVSAAFPLLEAGLRVLMVDGGKKASLEPPSDNFLAWRTHDISQEKWMLGKDFHALRMLDATSPKLRVPTLSYAFEQFSELNRISTDDFIAVGSLATGGLSNAWGCGVARFSIKELASFPCDTATMQTAYNEVAQRIGISGGKNDDLSDYFGLDDCSDDPLEIDKPHTFLYERYTKKREKLVSLGFRMGRSRVAVLKTDRADRKACNLSGNCLWGCYRKALYSSSDELSALQRFPNFFTVLALQLLLSTAHKVRVASMVTVQYRRPI